MPETLQERLATTRVLVVGDLILDTFVWGNVARVSPEAPVPVVEVTREETFLGGAANVARNLAELSPRISLSGRVGDDLAATDLQQILERRGIGKTGFIQETGARTTTKERIIARTQQVVRVDRESRHPLTPEYRSKVLDDIGASIGDFDAIILQDYAKGFIDQELVSGILQAAKTAGVPTTADPKPGNQIDWTGTTALKPNRSEVFALAGLPYSDAAPDPLGDAPLLEACRILQERWQNDYLLVTLSSQGMILVPRGGEPHHIPTEAREVYDVSGAGDTVIAVFTLALASGCTAIEAATLANRASGIVVGKLGTATVKANELFS